ncbi:HEAT repeat domain-containing protein [Streptomyces sp. NRRL WC-3549]|uniref:HEAT repeat domain-containing protein n=1 Tax=Streptomyces sp. NRRL WC-3549 TaxID=1463925 RepID=UPI00131C310D|nr:HEAT repeat domain-containing protein [Streptomyces sp. NRRL WC-3549]
MSRHDSRAVSGLFNHLAHQGTRCQASPYVVPFLARIVLAGPDPARELALELLTGLAVNWDEECAIMDGADIAAWRAEAAENSSDKLLPLYEEALAAEQDEQRHRHLRDIQDWVAAGNPVDARDSSMRSYDAVLAELPALRGLLDDENPRVRTRTAHLLAWFPELADTSLPLLLGLAAREDDAVAKATSLVAVGILGTTALPGTVIDSLDAEDGLVRWAAAAVAQAARRASAELDRPALDRAVAELAAAAAAPAPVPATGYSLGDFHGHTADVLLALPPCPASSAAVAACLPSVSPSQRASKAKAVLAHLFPGPLPEPRPPYERLSRPQQQLLHALADLLEGWWNTDQDLGGSLASHGLPATHAALRAYTGLFAAGNRPAGQ